jgi:hypothetical protein
MGKAAFIAGIAILLFFSSAGVMYAQNEESFVRESNISKRDAVLLSVLFPGLGQMTAGHKGKGVTLFFAGATSLAVFVNAHENYTTKLPTYNRDKEILDGMALRGRASYTEADKLYQSIKKQENKLDDLHRTRNIALYVAAGVYAYNLFDAIFLTSTSTESKKAESRGTITVQSALVDRKPGIVISKSF